MIAGDPDDAAELPVRVLLADAHAAMREAFAALLHADARIELVAEVCDPAGLLEILAAETAQVLLLDQGLLQSPLRAAIDGLRKRAAPGLRILMLGLDSEGGISRLALSAGADRYLLKDAAPEELLAAVRSAGTPSRGFYGPGARIPTHEPDRRPA